jgi:hypothetical protein
MTMTMTQDPHHQHDHHMTTDTSTSTRHQRQTTQHPARTRRGTTGYRMMGTTMMRTMHGGPTTKDTPQDTAPPSTAASHCSQGGWVVLQACGRQQGWDGQQQQQRGGGGGGRGRGRPTTTPGAAEPPCMSCARAFYFYLISFTAPPARHGRGQYFFLVMTWPPRANVRGLI